MRCDVGFEEFQAARGKKRRRVFVVEADVEGADWYLVRRKQAD